MGGGGLCVLKKMAIFQGQIGLLICIIHANFPSWSDLNEAWCTGKALCTKNGVVIARSSEVKLVAILISLRNRCVADLHVSEHGDRFGAHLQFRTISPPPGGHFSAVWCIGIEQLEKYTEVWGWLVDYDQGNICEALWDWLRRYKALARYYYYYFFGFFYETSLLLICAFWDMAVAPSFAPMWPHPDCSDVGIYTLAVYPPADV